MDTVRQAIDAISNVTDLMTNYELAEVLSIVSAEIDDRAEQHDINVNTLNQLKAEADQSWDEYVSTLSPEAQEHIEGIVTEAVEETMDEFWRGA